MDTITDVGSGAASRRMIFEFKGTATEYFGIWIVNLLLSIITLGIYTAWAKVRRLRYFYGNTWLDGHNFEYHAKPKQILIGRIIVVSALILYIVLTAISPFFVILLIPYLLALPWLINQSMAFNARMTSYRNVRFSFHGNYWRALGALVLLPMLIPVSGGLLAPLASRASSRYIGDNLKFGTANFDCNPRLGALYGNFGATALFAVVIAIIVGIAGAVVGSVLDASTQLTAENASEEVRRFVAGATVVAIVLSTYTSIFLAYIFYAAGVRNIAFGRATLDGKHQLASGLSRRRYVWILATNLMATILSVGLLRAWAAIRTWRYLALNTGFQARGNLDGFIDEVAPAGAAAAAEYFDIEGIEFGL